MMYANVISWCCCCCCCCCCSFCCYQGRVSLAEIDSIVRGRQPPDSGLMSDLLWTDPQPQLGRGPSKRGIGFCFGPDITRCGSSAVAAAVYCSLIVLSPVHMCHSQDSSFCIWLNFICCVYVCLSVYMYLFSFV